MSAGRAPWTTPTTGPLVGIHVLDFTQAAAGPFCTQHLGDLGATVTKIEPPGGDMIRGVDDPDRTGAGTYFMGLNRNKRFVRLDLRQAAGQEAARRLCQRTDIVVENYRPGTMARLGLGYDQLREDNPRLIYTSISAFGESGPLRGKPGMDIIVQGFAGIMGATGTEGGPPVKVGAPVADLATGYAAAMATLAALFERERSGRGQRISLSMFNVVVSLLSNVTTGYLLNGTQMERLGSAHPQLVPYQAFRAADGEYIVVGILNERFWAKLCAMLADPRLDDSRFTTNRDRQQHRKALVRLLDEIFAQRAAHEWERLCEEYDVPHTRVNSLREVFAHPQATATGLVVNIPDDHYGTVPTAAQAARFDRTPASYHAPPRRLGAHTVQVLEEAGYSAAEIDALACAGVI